MDKLTELANKYGTDKGTTENTPHSYSPTYNELFESLLDKPVRMLEIGVMDPRFPGASTKLWDEYFPDLYFVGYDINPNAKQFETERINIFIGDQNNPVDLLACVKKHGGNFDIILDDGSHYKEHILTSFLTLFPFLRNGGYYIIEDLNSPISEVETLIPELENIVSNADFKLDYKELKFGKLLIIKKASE